MCFGTNFYKKISLLHEGDGLMCNFYASSFLSKKKKVNYACSFNVTISKTPLH